MKRVDKTKLINKTHVLIKFDCLCPGAILSNTEKENIKGTTLDSLANMVARGFEGVDKRLDEHDKRFEAIDQRFDTVEHKLSKIDYRVDEVYDILARFEEGDILDLQKRIKILERAVKVLGKQLI